MNEEMITEKYGSIAVAEPEQKEQVEIKISGGAFYRFVKRAFDILSSGLFLLCFGWVILLLMFIKYAEDFGAKSYELEITEASDGKYFSKNGKRYNCKLKKNPNGRKDPTIHGPIYTSDRLGKDGKVFKLHKIRSMCPGAEAMRRQLIEYGINEMDGPAFKIADDPRITRFGKFLRKTSLDELPQIWDVFRGKMSVVGPRPPIPNEVLSYNAYQRHRLDVKGGLICTWQIHKNRNDMPFDEWVRLDIEYIEHRSCGLDFRLLMKAIGFILTDHTGE